MKWREYEDGTIGTDWRPDEAYSREAYDKMGCRLKMIQGLEISPRIRVVSNQIDLLLRLKNVSDLPFHSVSADGGCLQHLTERFFDQYLKTSYLVTAAGLHHLIRSVQWLLALISSKLLDKSPGNAHELKIGPDV